jgi:hypothetical protein
MKPTVVTRVNILGTTTPPFPSTESPSFPLPSTFFYFGVCFSPFPLAIRLLFSRLLREQFFILLGPLPEQNQPSLNLSDLFIVPFLSRVVFQLVPAFSWPSVSLLLAGPPYTIPKIAFPHQHEIYTNLVIARVVIKRNPHVGSGTRFGSSHRQYFPFDRPCSRS